MQWKNIHFVNLHGDSLVNKQDALTSQVSSINDFFESLRMLRVGVLSINWKR